MLIGLCVFTFVIVTFRVRVAEVGIAIAALGLMFHLAKVRIPFPVWIYGTFVAWTYLASFASPYQELAHEHILDQLKLVVVMLIIVNALETQGQLRFYLIFFLACFVLFPVRGTLINYFVVGYHPFGRAIWNYIYNNPNDLASLTLLTFGVSVSLASTSPPRTLMRYGTWISSMLLLIVMLLTQSRGAFLGLAVGMGPAFLKLGLKRPKYMIPLIIAAISIIAVIPDSVWERLSGIEKLTSVSTVAEADPEGSAAQRFEIQKVGWRIFQDNPVLGVGLGAYPLANASYAPELGKRDTHNTYLNLAVEAGLPGLILWLLLFGTVLRYARRIRRQNPTHPLALQQIWIERALIGYLVVAMFGTYGALTFPYLMLTILWSTATLLSKSMNTNTPQSPRQ